MNSASDKQQDDTVPNTSLHDTFFTDNNSGFVLNQNLDCKYYDITSFNNISKSFTSKLTSFFHLNINSLNLHFDNLELFLNSLNLSFSVIGLSETRITDNSTSPPKLPNYKCFSTPTKANYGGTLLYISNCFIPNRRTDLEKLMYSPKLLESTFAEIQVKNQPNIVVGSIYRHHSLPVNEFNNTFLGPLLDKVSKQGKQLIIMGDFNINILNSHTDTSSSNFVDTLSNFLMLPHINLPTRVCERSQTLIDNIILSPTSSKITSGNFIIGISDHLAQFVILENTTLNTQASFEKTYKDWKNFQKDKFVIEFKDFDWQSHMKLEQNNPDTSFKNFFNKLTNLIDQYTPTRKLSKKQLLNSNKPWITKGIMKSTRIRDKLLKKFINSKSDLNKTSFHNKYKIYRNKIVTLLKLSKSNFYKKCFNDNLNNSRETWKKINELIFNKQNNSDSHISLIVKDGIAKERLITEPSEIASTFNDFFCTIASDLNNKIPNFGNFEDYIKRPTNSNSFFFRAVTPTEMEETIKLLCHSKSTGDFSIPKQIFESVTPEIAKILTSIINQSFETGIFPSSLKIVKVIPIFKNKGSNQNLDNYRPISLLSNIDKIFEKLVHKRLTSYFNKYNLFFERQFGFRKAHSTNHTLITLTEEIRKYLDSGKFSCGVFIDLRKAFDTVNHEILLRKLELYGIRGITNKWFRSYLTKRFQYVSYNGKKSTLKELLFGVPQGSVLGPLLFIIYMNDLHNAILFSETTLFADDTCLLCSEPSLKSIEKHLNIDLRRLFKWLCANKISLNVSKTIVLLFRDPHRIVDHNISLFLNGKALEVSQSVKYLGIHIDNDLSWKTHVNVLSTKLRKANGIISKLRHFVPQSVLLSVYYSLFESHLRYACQIWAQNTNLNTSRIFKLQKQSCRLLTFSNYLSPSSPLFSQLKILKLNDLVKLLNVTLVYGILNNFLPSKLSEIYNLSRYPETHVTRGKALGLLTRKQCKTSKYGINSVVYQSIIHWNNLQSLYPGSDLTQFSKQHLINLYTSILFANY